MNVFKGTTGGFIYDSKYNTVEIEKSKLAERGIRMPQTIAKINTSFISEEEAHANGKLLGSSKKMLKMLIDAKSVIGILKRSILVHPDHEEGSEFDDLTTTAQEIEDRIKLLIKNVTSI